MHMRPLTIDDLRRGLILAAWAAEAGTLDTSVGPLGYDQARWTPDECGTACCVHGWAHLATRGVPADGGPSRDDYRSELIGDRIARELLAVPTPQLELMARVLGRESVAGVDLYGAGLSRADLSGAYLSRAYLSRADLSGAYLTRAKLTGANLIGADLRGADLSLAYLSGAYLSRANLRGADLSGAYLSGAYLSGAYLSGALRSPDDAPLPGWVVRDGRLQRA